MTAGAFYTLARRGERTRAWAVIAFHFQPRQHSDTVAWAKGEKNVTPKIIIVLALTQKAK